MNRPKYWQLGDREWLYEHYVDRRMTHLAIAELIGCTKRAVQGALKRKEIPSRGHIGRGVTGEDYDAWIEKGGIEENRPIGPAEHKAAAAELGVKLDELLVLSKSADPFFCGSPADVREAEWFEALWIEHGAIGHLRRLHYRLVSGEERVTLPEGREYANDEYSFGRLIYAGAQARHLDLVEAVDFTDRRNPPAIINVYGRIGDAEPGAEVDATEVDWRSHSLPHVPDSYFLNVHPFKIPEPDVVGYDYERADQPVLVEVWIEKTTMNDILEPLCARLGINLVPASGMQSITSAVKLVERCRELDKPGHVIYISDFDPAGDTMPRAVARQVEFRLQRDYPDVQITLDPVALTYDQVTDLELPRIPTKEDDRRAAGFEERYGEGAVELDALEATKPGELARLVREAVEPYQDPDLAERLTSTWDAARQNAEEAWAEDTEDLRAELEKLAVQAREAAAPFRERLTALHAEFEQAIAPTRERTKELEAELQELADSFDPDLPERDEPELYLDDQDPLYDSERPHLEQLERYKRDRG